MRLRVLIAVMAGLLATATAAKADQIGALLTGYEESPSVSTTASGEFTATITPDGNAILYRETFSGLQATDNSVPYPCRPAGRERQRRHLSLPDGDKS